MGHFRFWPFFFILAFWGFQWGLGVLGLLVSCKIARGIKLALRRVNYWFWGGFERVLVGLGGSKGVCVTPIKHFWPLWKPCMTPDFGSKRHIMAQLAYVNRVGITDPLSDLWSSPKGYNISRIFLGTLESSKIPYIWVNIAFYLW